MTMFLSSNCCRSVHKSSLHDRTNTSSVIIMIWGNTTLLEANNKTVWVIFQQNSTTKLFTFSTHIELNVFYRHWQAKIRFLWRCSVERCWIYGSLSFHEGRMRSNIRATVLKDLLETIQTIAITSLYDGYRHWFVCYEFHCCLHYCHLLAIKRQASLSSHRAIKTWRQPWNLLVALMVISLQILYVYFRLQGRLLKDSTNTLVHFLFGWTRSFWMMRYSLFWSFK